MARIRRVHFLAGCVVLALAACVPIFTDGAFQTLKLIFELSEAIEDGEEKLLQVSAFPASVKVKKTFVRISGQLTVADGEQLPSRARVVAVFENEATGKVTQRVSVNLNVKEDGHFSASARVKKNIGNGDMMSVTLEPSGASLARKTGITLCVDLVKKKSELNNLPACIEVEDGGSGGSPITLASLQDEFFTPTCARSGCHTGASAPGGLSLVAGQSFGNLVNVPSSQVAEFNRVTPNDPNMSYLIKKLRGDGDIIGERMPRGGPFLSAEEFDRFVSWINDGALDN